MLCCGKTRHPESSCSSRPGEIVYDDAVDSAVYWGKSENSCPSLAERRNVKDGYSANDIADAISSVIYKCKGTGSMNCVFQSTACIAEREISEVVAVGSSLLKTTSDNFGDLPTDDGVNRASLSSLRACFYICIRPSVRSVLCPCLIRAESSRASRSVQGLIISARRHLQRRGET